MELEKMTIEEVKQLYEKLQEELLDFESDIKYTLEALEDKRVDYMQKTEFRNDLKYDKEQIEIISEKISIIENYMKKNPGYAPENVKLK